MNETLLAASQNNKKGVKKRVKMDRQHWSKKTRRVIESQSVVSIWESCRHQKRSKKKRNKIANLSNTKKREKNSYREAQRKDY